MKSKSSNKIFYISFSAILLLAVLHSCDIDSRHEFECLNTNPHNVTIEDALENLNSALDLINGGTKSPISAEIANVRLITPFDLPLDTKSQSGQNDFEQLVYVVDFEDEQGFAVLGADDRFVPVLVITEQGSSPKNIVDPPSLDPGTTSPDGLTLDQLYCEEDDEYYLGGNEDMVGTLISDYIVKTMNGGVNPPGMDDGSDPNPGDDDPTNPGEDIPGGGTDYTIVPALLNTKWSQNYPFNSDITHTDFWGRPRPIGCTTTATIQILAYLKNVSLENKFGITNSTWYDIENCEYGLANDPQLSSDLAVLGKKAADGIGVIYNFAFSGQTFATPSAAKRYLKSLGYSGAKTNIGYSLTKIKDMLKLRKPVLIGALPSNIKGHAWVIDGIYEQRNTSYPANKQTLLHCNWGWGGNADGYYESELFDLTQGAVMFDDKDTGSSDTRNMSDWWWFRIVTY